MRESRAVYRNFAKGGELTIVLCEARGGGGGGGVLHPGEDYSTNTFSVCLSETDFEDGFVLSLQRTSKHEDFK